MTDSWEDAPEVPTAPLASVTLASAPAPAAAQEDDDWFGDQRRDTEKAEKRERKGGAPKILKRVSSKGDVAPKPQRRSPTQTDAEREATYAAARARIFAEESVETKPATKKGNNWASAALTAAAKPAEPPVVVKDDAVARGPAGAGFDPKARERTRENAKKGLQQKPMQRRPSRPRVAQEDAGDPDYRRGMRAASAGEGYGVYDGRPGYSSTREEYYAQPPQQDPHAEYYAQPDAYGAQPLPDAYAQYAEQYAQQAPYPDHPDAYARGPPPQQQQYARGPPPPQQHAGFGGYEQQYARGPPPQQHAGFEQQYARGPPPPPGEAFGGYGQAPPPAPDDYGASAFGGALGFAPYTPAEPTPAPAEPRFRPPPPPPQFRAQRGPVSSPALAPPEAGGNPHGLATLGDMLSGPVKAPPQQKPPRGGGRGGGRGRGRAKGRGQKAGGQKGKAKPRVYEAEFPTL